MLSVLCKANFCLFVKEAILLPTKLNSLSDNKILELIAFVDDKSYS